MLRYTELSNLCAQFEKLASEPKEDHKPLQDKMKAYMAGWQDRTQGKPKRPVIESHLRSHYDKGWDEARHEFAFDRGVNHLQVIK